MSLSRARALCPEAEVQMASPGQTRRAVQINLTRISAYTQWVEAEHHAAQTATLFADLGRLTIKDGQQIAEQITQMLGEHGFKASIGLASNKFVAHVAADSGHCGSVSIVRKGDEAAYLASRSVAHLPLDTETAGGWIGWVCAVWDRSRLYPVQL